MLVEVPVVGIFVGILSFGYSTGAHDGSLAVDGSEHHVVRELADKLDKR